MPFPSPGHLPDPGIELASPAASAAAGGFFTTEPPVKPSCLKLVHIKEISLSFVIVLLFIYFRMPSSLFVETLTSYLEQQRLIFYGWN